MCFESLALRTIELIFQCFIMLIYCSLNSRLLNKIYAGTVGGEGLMSLITVLHM